MGRTSEIQDQANSEVAPRAPARAEGVGSLLRPRALKDAFERAYGGELYVDLSASERQAALYELDQLALAATPELVRRQIDAGLDVVTDGELRRGLFINSVIDAVNGIDLAGERHSEGKAAADSPEEYAVPIVRQRVSKKANPAAREAALLADITAYPKKVTFPAASYFFYDMFIAVGEEAYPDREAFVDDLVKLERNLVDEVIAAGVEHIQFDFPLYPMLVDPSAAARAAAAGETPEALLEKALKADAEVIADLPEHVTSAMHLCRGNQVRFFTGSVAPIAERIFALPYDRFLIEWHDTEHDGSYDPIRFVPAPKIMVMGLVSTKSPVVEDEDEVLRRLEAAAALLDVGQLAISPQCGFASTWQGYSYGEEIQWRKLEVAGRVAERIWGGR
jgi:5-methyltetrahydropteroyltriglutamate--homocysteine methyltransferase